MVSEEINFLVFETYALIRVTVYGKKTKIKRNQYKRPLYAWWSFLAYIWSDLEQNSFPRVQNGEP